MKPIKSWLLDDPGMLFVGAVKTTWGGILFCLGAIYFGNLAIVLPRSWPLHERYEWFFVPWGAFITSLFIGGLSFVGWPFFAVETYCLYCVLYTERSRFWIFWSLVLLQLLLPCLLALLPVFGCDREDIVCMDSLVTLLIVVVPFIISLALRRFVLKQSEEAELTSE